MRKKKGGKGGGGRPTIKSTRYKTRPIPSPSIAAKYTGGQQGYPQRREAVEE